jgi:hypothetical protein
VFNAAVPQVTDYRLGSEGARDTSPGLQPWVYYQNKARPEGAIEGRAQRPLNIPVPNAKLRFLDDHSPLNRTTI